MSTILVSVPSPAKLAIFALTPSGITLCSGCGHQHRDTLAPVETIHADGSVTTTGAELCQACCLSFPLLAQEARVSWPVLTARDLESLWTMVRKEQIAQALELAGPQQGLDRIGKVA